MLASGAPPLVAAAVLLAAAAAELCPGEACGAAVELEEETSLLSVRERAASGSPPCLTPYRTGNRMFQACCGGLEWADLNGTDYCVPWGTYRENTQSGQKCQADGDICRDNAGRGPCCSGSCMGSDEECQAGQCTCKTNPYVQVPLNGVCKYTVAWGQGETHANVYPCTGGTTCATQDWMGVGVCLPATPA